MRLASLRRFRATFDLHAYRACPNVLMVASDWLAAELVVAGSARQQDAGSSSPARPGHLQRAVGPTPHRAGGWIGPASDKAV